MTLEVLGGAAGVAADLADVRRTAGLLDACGSDVAALAGRVRAAASAGCLLVSAPLSPVTAARAEAALLEAGLGPAGLTVLALRLEASAVVLRVRADLLELADGGVDLAGLHVREVAATAVGHAARTLVVPLAGGALAVGGGLLAAELLEGAGDLLLDALRGDVPVSDLDDRLTALPGAALDGVADRVRGALDRLDLDARAQDLLREHPQVTEAVTAGLPDALQGFAGPAGPLLPDDLEGVVAALLAVGRSRGLLTDSDVRAVRSPVAPPPLAFASLADLFASQAQLAEGTRHRPSGSAVRVRRVDDGGAVRWVVQVPGTQEWGPRAGRDPSDTTTNLELMDDGRAALLAGVLQAMRDAGVGAHDDVLLTGHSQGGIAALALACDPVARAEFRGLDTVVTAGSPVGRLRPPPDVTVLSLEHLRDPVPRLDGSPNPDAARWTTVRRDALPDVVAQHGPGSAAALDPVSSHGGSTYTATAAAVDASRDPALQPVLSALAPFLGGRGETLDYVLDRPAAPLLP